MYWGEGEGGVGRAGGCAVTEGDRPLAGLRGVLSVLYRPVMGVSCEPLFSGGSAAMPHPRAPPRPSLGDLVIFHLNTAASAIAGAGSRPPKWLNVAKMASRIQCRETTEKKTERGLLMHPPYSDIAALQCDYLWK